jgi:hypothetical protein
MSSIRSGKLRTSNRAVMRLPGSISPAEGHTIACDMIYDHVTDYDAGELTPQPD